jgi:hypothetical protein
METACKVTTLGRLAKNCQRVTWKVKHNKSLFLEKTLIVKMAEGPIEEKS